MPCFGVMFLCWASQSSQASGFPRAVKAMPVKCSHHALFGIVFLCWAQWSSRASGPPCAVKAMPVKGSHHALFWYCVFVLSLAVRPSPMFPTCREGGACYYLPAFASGVIVSIIGDKALYMAVAIHHHMSASGSKRNPPVQPLIRDHLMG